MCYFFSQRQATLTHAIVVFFSILIHCNKKWTNLHLKDYWCLNGTAIMQCLKTCHVTLKPTESSGVSRLVNIFFYRTSEKKPYRRFDWSRWQRNILKWNRSSTCFTLLSKKKNHTMGAVKYNSKNNEKIICFFPAVRWLQGEMISDFCLFSGAWEMLHTFLVKSVTNHTLIKVLGGRENILKSCTLFRVFMVLVIFT